MSIVFRVIKKSINLLSSKEKRKLLGLTVMVMIMSVVELFGIASIFPFMTVATNPESIKTNEYLFFVYRTFRFKSTENFLLALACLSMFALLVGNSFRAISSYLLLRFAHMQNHQLGKRILESYLCMPYEYFLTQNSSNLTKNVVTEVAQVVNGIFVPLLKSLGRLFAAFSIVLMLIVLDPLIALAVSCALFFSYLLIFQGLKGWISKIGAQRTDMNDKRIRLVSEISGGIKEIKFMGKERVYLNDFNLPSEKFAKAKAYNAATGELPRHLLEVVAFGGILLTVIYLITTEGSSSQAISTTSLYAFAGYKLLPALQDIFHSITKVRFSASALEDLERNFKADTDLENKFEVTPIKLPFDDYIEVNNLFFYYRDSDHPALNGLSLKVEKNESIGIVGPTGSGKSTLIDILLGLLRPTRGQVIIDGKALREKDVRGWQANIGYVPQHIYLSDDTVASNIAFGVPKDDIDHEMVRKAAEQAQVANFIENNMPESYETFVGERGVKLSGGQRQRIGIARSLYHDPSLIVFDEATSALDKKTEEDVIGAIERLSGTKTMIMVAHRTSTLQACNRILYLENGNLSEFSSIRDIT